MTEMPRKNVPPPLELVKGRIAETLPPEAKERIEAGELRVVDVRDPANFAESHIDGAVNLPAGEEGIGAHDDAYAVAVEEVLGNRDAPVLLYCGSGNKSSRTADALTNNHGFAGAISMIGGITLWKDLGYDVSDGS